VEFSAIFHRSKVIRLFEFACKMPFEIFGKVQSPEKFLLDETPKGTSLGKSASFEVSRMQIGSVIWSIGREKKKSNEK
jgi:hypothetical protein